MVLQTVHNFGKVPDAVDIPDLVAIQKRSYGRFLQKDVAPTKRKCIGLEALLREIFPIQNYDATMYLEYLYYELEEPRYTRNECRQLRLTYSYPLKICCRLRTKDGEDVAEQAIYLGEMPVMIGGGEFIINGAERVIVSQLHRSPGVDFLIGSKEGDRVLHGGRIIPERGSWIEIGVTRKDVLVIKIDQSSKIPATIFLRAISPDYGTTEEILRLFYETKNVPAAKLTPNMWAVGPIVDKETGEIIVKAGTQIGDRVTLIQNAKILASGSSIIKFDTRKKAEEWLKKEKGSAWLEAEQKNLRKKYIVKGGKRTGGFAFKCVETKNTLTKAQLEAVETKLIGSEQPRFNKDSGKSENKVKELWAENPYLETFYHECKDAIKSDAGWVEIKNLKECKKGLPDKQGIYFFRGLKTKKVKDGYLGSATSLRDRLGKHFGVGATFKAGKNKNIGDCGDNLLKTWVLTELEEYGVTIEGGERKDGRIEVIGEARDTLILTTLAEDDCQSHEQALLKFYMRLRPGNPPNPEKAKAFLAEKFFDVNRYRLGRVGRFRLNRKFEQSVDENEMTLRPEDFLNTMKYILALRNNEGKVDDIDHLGNRRLRTIEELAGDEIRKGLLKLRKTVQERMSIRKDVDEPIRIADLVNSKSVSSSINYFFGRGELSQVVDQTNALSQLTHERRLSALGPGGLNRRRAGFEVRDVHISHYGRVCPIETPEGTNIGLIASLAIFAAIDEYGFLLTPYRKVKNGKVTDKVDYLRADEDMKAIIAAPGTIDQKTSRIREGMVLAMRGGELAQVSSDEINYVDISTKQTVGVSASLVPFLEHDDANRALMGSNMQRQAVPLLKTEAPLVGTGMEEVVGRNSSMVVRAEGSGVVTAVDSQHIVINHTDEYKLDKFVGLNERTCLNQKPIVGLGESVRKGQIIADGGGTANGVLALGRNILVGFVSFDGFNFEDAIIVSEKLVKNDSFTSIHIDEFTAEVRETRLGSEEFTCDIPNVGERALRNLDEHGVIREGTRVCPGDILVGKVVPKSKTELTPEEKLLHAIFGRAGEDVKNDSLELPTGYEGVVIRTERFARRGAGSDEQKKALRTEMRQYEKQMREKTCLVFKQMVEAIHKKKVGKKGGEKEPEKAITSWMRENLDCICCPFELKNDVINWALEYFENNLTIKTEKEKTKVSRLLSFIEDRLIIEYKDNQNPGNEKGQKKPAPYFNREYPKKDDYEKIKKVWKNAPERVKPVKEWVDDRIKHIGETDEWINGKPATKDVPGLYAFRKTKSSKYLEKCKDIVYVGISRNIRDRLNQHWGGNIKGSELRKHIWKDIVSERIGESVSQLTSDVNIVDPSTRQKVGESPDDEVIYEQIEGFDIKWVRPASVRENVQKIVDKFWVMITQIQEQTKRRLERFKRGDELPSGVLEMVKVYVATKRMLSVGDKIAGRHGNKGVIAKIMPEEDMPFLEDGTSLDILLNPLGVPSRMNVGQILETHLGWVAKVLGLHAVSPVFDGATEDDIRRLTVEANELMSRRKAEFGTDRTPWYRDPKSAPNEPGIYFFRNKFTKLVNDGYVGIAGPDRKDGLRGRMKSHYNQDDDSLLLAIKKWLQKEKEESEQVTIEEAKQYIRSELEYKFITTSEISREDLEDFENRLMLEYPDKKNPVKRAHLPRFNTKNERVPYNDKQLIAKFKDLWEKGATEKLKDLFKRCKTTSLEANKLPPDDEFFINVPKTLKTQLYDGRTGEPFDQSATIGFIYMMKLHHLVDDKIHARATGPYSLITQQPLGGKTRTGGQRFGEMEVWALEGYGAAYTLQEMLTVKSDDVEGRTKIYESMVKGQNSLEAGTPLSFDVLCNEIRGLGLNIQLEKKRLGGTTL